MNIRTQRYFIEPYADKQELESERHLNKIIEKEVKLSQELNINDALSCCNLYTYLLFGGVFSEDGTFHLEERGNKYPAEMIMLGCGDSYAVSDMLEMFLTKMEFENYSPEVLLDYEKLKIDYEPKLIKHKISYPMIQGALYHHPVNLVLNKDNNSHFVYDASLSALLSVKNNKKLQLVNGKGSMNLSYPLSNVFDSGTFDMKETPNFLTLVSKMKGVSKEVFIQTFEENINTFKKNKNLIREFKDDIESDVLGVCKSMKK